MCVCVWGGLSWVAVGSILWEGLSLEAGWCCQGEKAVDGTGSWAGKRAGSRRRGKRAWRNVPHALTRPVLNAP